MKKTLVSLAVSLGLSAQAVQYNLLNGNLYTNANAVYNQIASATNSSGVYSNNFQLGVVPGASNVFWTVSNVAGTQPTYTMTNPTPSFLPALPFPLAGTPPTGIGGYPNTLYGPANNVTISVSGALMATNGSSTTITFTFAGYDGTLITSNYLSMGYIVPINSTTATVPTLTTNITTGGMPWLILQNINNPGVAAFTNAVIDLNTKPGI